MPDKSTVHVTPRGVFRYPRLNSPDTRFRETGEYHVQLVLSKDDAEELINLITEAHDDWYKRYLLEKKQLKANPRKKAPYPFTVEVDPETGLETGNIIFKFKMSASGVSKRTGKIWTRRPIVFDSKGVPINLDKVMIRGGTEGRIAFSFFEYESTPQQGAGVSLKIEAVQILKLVSGDENKTAQDFGFRIEEGYTERQVDDDLLDPIDLDGGADAPDGNVETETGDF